MAVAAATSALFELLFEKLASVAIEQFGRLLGVTGDLEKLKSTLSAIEGVIQDAEERAVEENAVRDWVAKLLDAAYDADDLLEELQTEFERRKAEIQQAENLAKLKRTLSAIEAVIEDAKKRALNDDWVAKLHDAADVLLDEFLTEFERRKAEIQQTNLGDAADLLEELQTEFERRKAEIQIQQDSLTFRKVRTFFSRSNPLAFRINMCFKFKSIAEKLAMIAEERSRYQLREFRILPQMDTRTSAVIDETTVYGRGHDLEKIVKLLLETETDRDDLSVVPIVGLGGLGKTTLAQLAYNQERVVESFDLKIWVYVSDKF